MLPDDAEFADRVHGVLGLSMGEHFYMSKDRNMLHAKDSIQLMTTAATGQHLRCSYYGASNVRNMGVLASFLRTCMGCWTC